MILTHWQPFPRNIDDLAAPVQLLYRAQRTNQIVDPHGRDVRFVQQQDMDGRAAPCLPCDAAEISGAVYVVGRYP